MQVLNHLSVNTAVCKIAVTILCVHRICISYLKSNDLKIKSVVFIENYFLKLTTLFCIVPNVVLALCYQSN